MLFVAVVVDVVVIVVDVIVCVDVNFVVVADGVVDVVVLAFLQK